MTAPTERDFDPFVSAPVLPVPPVLCRFDADHRCIPCIPGPDDRAVLCAVSPTERHGVGGWTLAASHVRLLAHLIVAFPRFSGREMARAREPVTTRFGERRDWDLGDGGGVREVSIRMGYPGQLLARVGCLGFGYGRWDNGTWRWEKR